MPRVKRIFTGGALAAAAACALAFAPAAASAHRLLHAPKHALGHDTSGNWSGYAVDGSNASFVTASWVQPYSTNCSIVPNAWSSPWVGIDGDNSATVEQTGTDSDCVKGQPYYYAWWEMYPAKTRVIPNFTVTPGDSFTASVLYGANGFTMTLTDATSGAHFTTTSTSKKAARSSVEWIMEGPSSGNLTDFGSIGFTGASATIGGQTVSPASGTPITMVTNQGVDRAVPSLGQHSGAFGVTWKHS